MAGLKENDLILIDLRDAKSCGGYPLLAIEKVEPQGSIAVGAETFETVFFSGRAAQSYGLERVARIGRKAIKLHLCDTTRANDTSIRMAIIDRFGGKDKAVGKRSNPGPLFGITGHGWAALAVAITAYDLTPDESQSVSCAALPSQSKQAQARL